MKNIKNWLEEWIDNGSYQAETEEKAVIYYRKRKNKNILDVLINYCSDKKLKVIETYNAVSCYKKNSKKSLFDMLSLINTQNDRIHVVCNDFYEIFYDDGDLQILEPLITAGKIAIHIHKENLIIDKNNYNANMIVLIYLMKSCSLSHHIRVAKNYKKNISKS